MENLEHFYQEVTQWQQPGGRFFIFLFGHGRQYYEACDDLRELIKNQIQLFEQLKQYVSMLAENVKAACGDPPQYPPKSTRLITESTGATPPLHSILAQIDNCRDYGEGIIELQNHTDHPDYLNFVMDYHRTLDCIDEQLSNVIAFIEETFIVHR